MHGPFLPRNYDAIACNYGGRRFLRLRVLRLHGSSVLATTTPSATVDDASCDFACYGCTDPDACNYDAISNSGRRFLRLHVLRLHGSRCLQLRSMQLTAFACYLDDDASCDVDDSCACYGCTDPAACNYEPQRQWTTLPATSRRLHGSRCLQLRPARIQTSRACNYDAISNSGRRFLRLRVLRLHGSRCLQLRRSIQWTTVDDA